MKAAPFIYVTYILSTPAKVWQALTDPEITKNYWFNHANRSDWKPGSRWSHEDADNPKTVEAVIPEPAWDKR